MIYDSGSEWTLGEVAQVVLYSRSDLTNGRELRLKLFSLRHVLCRDACQSRVDGATVCVLL